MFESALVGLDGSLASHLAAWSAAELGLLNGRTELLRVLESDEATGSPSQVASIDTTWRARSRIR